MSDDSNTKKGYATIPEPTEQGLVLTSWALVLKLNRVYCSHLDRLVADEALKLKDNPLFDQMTKNNHITSMKSLREIMSSEFGMQLLLLVLKESEFVEYEDLRYSLMEPSFRGSRTLNKNSIANHIFRSLPEGTSHSLRSIQGQVEKTVNTMILLGLVEVDTLVSKGNMKALSATKKLNEFARSWCFEAARLLKSATVGASQ